MAGVFTGTGHEKVGDDDDDDMVPLTRREGEH